MVIIGVCGFQGSGKDTIGNYLVSKYNFTRLSFASSVKDVASSLFGWDRTMLEGLTEEARAQRDMVDEWWADAFGIKGFTPRFVMQKIGTEIFRENLHPDIWLKIVEKKIIDMSKNQSNPNIVITDCRFPNEFAMIKKHGGIIINVHKDLPEWFNDLKLGRIEQEELSKLNINLHLSEISWIKEEFDFTLDNTGSFAELENKIDLVIEKVSI